MNHDQPAQAGQEQNTKISVGPLMQKMMWRVAKIALKKVPIVGYVYEIIDDVILRSIKETHQEEVNQLLEMLNQKLLPVIRKLAQEDLPDEQLVARLEQSDMQHQLQALRQEFEARYKDFDGITKILTCQIEQHGAQIQNLTEAVAQLNQSLDIGSQFKYIAQCVKHRINMQGHVSQMYDSIQKISEAGGQSEVYRVHRRSTLAHQTAVVKILKERRTNNTKAIQRFLLEGFLSSQIIHSNIVRVKDYGGFWLSNEYYIEMEDLGETTWKQWADNNPCTHQNFEKYLD